MFKINTSVPQLPGSLIHPFIVMNGIHFIHLKHIIDFMYQGEIKVLDSDLEGVLALGESLQVKGLCSVKLKQKIGLNNEVKSTEQSVSPLQQTTPSKMHDQSMFPLHQQIHPRTQEQSCSPVDQPTISSIQGKSVSSFSQTVSPKPQSIPVESKICVENQLNETAPLKVPNLNNSTPPIPLTENVSVYKSQEQARNYSKVTLDALAQINTTKKVNNVIKQCKNEETVFTMPTVTNHPDQLEQSEEHVSKKMKVDVPPVVVRSVNHFSLHNLIL